MQALVFVDITDAWSYVGAVRFERAAALHTILTGEPVEIGYRAMSPHPATPAKSVAAAARVSGIELNVDDIVDADSTDAWRLLLWSALTGPEHQRELLHQLWRAHLLEGADIADPLVLVSRAALAGLRMDDAEVVLASGDFLADVETQRRVAADMGALETPFVVIDKARSLTGVHSQDDYVRALREIAAGG